MKLLEAPRKYPIFVFALLPLFGCLNSQPKLKVAEFQKEEYILGSLFHFGGITIVSEEENPIFISNIKVNNAYVAIQSREFKFYDPSAMPFKDDIPPGEVSFRTIPTWQANRFELERLNSYDSGKFILRKDTSRISNSPNDGSYSIVVYAQYQATVNIGEEIKVQNGNWGSFGTDPVYLCGLPFDPVSHKCKEFKGKIVKVEILTSKGKFSGTSSE